MKSGFRTGGHKSNKLFNLLIIEIQNSVNPKAFYKHLKTEFGEIKNLDSKKLTGVLSYIKTINKGDRR